MVSMTDPRMPSSETAAELQRNYVSSDEELMRLVRGWLVLVAEMSKESIPPSVRARPTDGLSN